MKNLVVEELLRPLINELGFELWACEYLPQGKHSILRIYIDHENGIKLDDCSLVSSQVSAVLDVEDPIAGNYSLEVSSPGLDRPLFDLEHYQKYIGKEVKLKLNKAVSKRRKLAGTIQQVNENIITIGLNNENVDVDISNIAKANIII